MGVAGLERTRMPVLKWQASFVLVSDESASGMQSLRKHSEECIEVEKLFQSLLEMSEQRKMLTSNHRAIIAADSAKVDSLGNAPAAAQKLQLRLKVSSQPFSVCIGQPGTTSTHHMRKYLDLQIPVHTPLFRIVLERIAGYLFKCCSEVSCIV